MARNRFLAHLDELWLFRVSVPSPICRLVLAFVCLFVCLLFVKCPAQARSS